MIFRKINIAVLIFCSIPLTSNAQEVLTGLETNSALQKSYKEHKNSLRKKNVSIPDTLSLPFFDDFSDTQVYPSPQRWADSYVFINSTYPLNPLSTGVATFDAIDETGKVYENASKLGFVADTLTSAPLDLNFPASSNIYLSFYYQPQGIGDSPEAKDSIILQFYAKDEDTWQTVWQKEGSEVYDFKPAIIQISDEKFLKRGFRFRFLNKASISENVDIPSRWGNVDHWHMDYVYLNQGRNANDTIVNDVSMTRPLESFLKRYYAMPWTHFQEAKATEMAINAKITYQNNDDETKQIFLRQFQVTDVFSETLVHEFTGGAENIEPQENKTYETAIGYSFQSGNADSAEFLLKAFLVTDENDNKWNDTVSFRQKFYNYYALDDGTAENGYGILHTGRVAFQFYAHIQDSLRAVKMYFNQTKDDASRQYFYLMVWADDNGKPGEILYRKEGYRPEYENELNRYHTYLLDSVISVEGTFYVGWEKTTNDILNIGFDANTQHQDKIFYTNTSQVWENSSFNGTLMIRPVLSKNKLPTHTSAIKPQSKAVLYPNPVKDILTIGYPGLDRYFDHWKYRLIDVTGKIMMEKEGFTNQLDLSSYPKGIYILQIEKNNHPYSIHKLFISH